MSEEPAAAPNHIGLILDGNRRWAKQNGVSPLEGHNRGLEVFLEVVPVFYDKGVQYVSAFAFSTENWGRAKEEVAYLMRLFYKVAKDKLNELHEKNIRAVFLGRRDRLDNKLVQAIEEIEAKTEHNSRGTLALCLNYGGTYEIADALKSIIASKKKATEVTPELVAKHLYHPEIPVLDLIVRTSGEQRLSNFMLWRSAYAELLFIEKHWPEVTKQDAEAILKAYAKRVRRFGE